MRDKIARAKELAHKYSYELTFVGGMAVGVGILAMSLKPSEYTANRYPWGSVYDSDRPIPNLLLTEDEIKRRIASGIIAAEFIDDKGLTEKYLRWAYTRVADMREEMAAAA